jgi:hypothetical protein
VRIIDLVGFFQALQKIGGDEAGRSFVKGECALLKLRAAVRFMMSW